MLAMVAVNSIRGIVAGFKGATLAFPITNAQCAWSQLLWSNKLRNHPHTHQQNDAVEQMSAFQSLWV